MNKARISDLTSLQLCTDDSSPYNQDRQRYKKLQNHWRWYCRHEIKRHLLLGRKAMTNLDTVQKKRDITLPTKVYTAKTMVFQ